MAKYRPIIKQPITVIHDRDRYKNQVVLSGASESFSVAKGIFYLEYLEVASGSTVDIADGEGNQIIPATSGFNLAHSPLRCDYGVQITGTCVFAKGFFIEGCIE